jgi:hypothetical protein
MDGESRCVFPCEQVIWIDTAELMRAGNLDRYSMKPGFFESNADGLEIAVQTLRETQHETSRNSTQS